MPDDANALIAQGIKPPPAPDFVGPLTALSNMAHAQAQSDLARAQTGQVQQATQFTQGKLGSIAQFQADKAAGMSDEQALLHSNLGAWDPAGAKVMQENYIGARDIAATRKWSQDPTNPYAIAGAGPKAVSEAVGIQNTQADIAKKRMETSTGNAVLVGMIGNGMAADPSVEGRYRMAMMAKSLGPVLGISEAEIDHIASLPQDQYLQRAKQFQLAGMNAEQKYRVTGQEAYNKGIAELQTYIGKYGPTEAAVRGPAAEALSRGQQPGPWVEPGTAGPGAPAPVPGAPAVAPGAPTAVPSAAGPVRPPSFTQPPPGVVAPGAARAPAAPAPSPYSGGRLPTFATQPGSGTDLSANMIRHFEGFLSTPRWDKTAYRAGFGSDTKTNPDGSVEPIRPGMYISPADAERDLQRRITQEFQPRVQQQIGGDTWNRLSPQAQASLTSVAYNYGKLPPPVASAARTGNPDAIAQAIASLPTNQNRRLQEANYINGGFAVPGGVTTVPFSGRRLEMPAGPVGIPGPDTTASWLLAAKAGGIPAPTAPPLPVPHLAQKGAEPPAPAAAPVIGAAPAPAPGVGAAPAVAPAATPAATPAPGASPIPTIENPTGAAVPKTGLAADQAAPLTHPGMSLEEKGRIEEYAKLPMEYDRSAVTANRMNYDIHNMQMSSNSWEPGQWASWEQAVRKQAQAFGKFVGVPDSQMEALNKAAGDYDATVKVMGTLVRDAAHEVGSRNGVQELVLIGRQSPSPEMTRYGLNLVFSQMQGINDFQMAKQVAANKWIEARRLETGQGTLGPSPNTGGMDFQTYWNKHASMDAFMLHRMGVQNPEMLQSQIKEMIKTSSGLADLKRINAARKWAINDGLLSPTPLETQGP